MRPVDPARSRLVLVGVPAYTDPALPDVPVIGDNIADFAAVLTDPDLGGFDAAHCAVAPSGAGIEQIGDLLHQAAAEAEDLLLFYYSGHGLLGPLRRELYLTLAGTRSDRLAFTALAFDAVRDAFLASRAACRVVILDACFSGRAIGETLAGAEDAVLGQIQVGGTYTLTSAPANRTALVLPGEGHTAFTERMLHLLRDGSAEAGSMLSLGDIHRHLHTRLHAEGLPLPQQRGTETAHLLGLVRNRAFQTVEQTFVVSGVAADDLVLVGSIPALGNWNTDRAIPMIREGSSWTTTVPMPRSAPFEYKYLVRTVDGSVTWEADPNHSAISGAGTLTDAWHGPVSVTFKAHVSTDDDQAVYLVGSIAALGDWNPAIAVPLSADAYPVWSTTLWLPKKSTFFYKYVKKTATGEVEWESDPNRSATIGTESSQVLDDKWR